MCSRAKASSNSDTAPCLQEALSSSDDEHAPLNLRAPKPHAWPLPQAAPAESQRLHGKSAPWPAHATSQQPYGMPASQDCLAPSQPLHGLPVSRRFPRASIPTGSLSQPLQAFPWTQSQLYSPTCL